MTPPTERTPITADVLDNLVQVSFAVIALLSRVAAANELSLTQLRMLAILRDREPTMAALATHLGLERSSVSGLIDRSVDRGLARRRPSNTDGRAVHLRLTPTGRRLARRLTAEVTDLVAAMTSDLTPAQRRRLGELLAKVAPAGPAG
jgi:DNA-binding MarR family transcriptional regulator